MLRSRDLLLSLVLLARVPAGVADDDTSSRVPLRDADDGWFDMSAFLDTAYGFVPVVSPITEPAVGCGAVAAAVFVDRKPEPDVGPATRPNIATLGALGTENGTRGAFGGHLGTWRGGRRRTLAGLAAADVNLTHFGLVGFGPDEPVIYVVFGNAWLRP